MNDMQRILLKTYAEGDNAHLIESQDNEATIRQWILDHGGDTLLAFLFIELSTKEDCDSFKEARRRVNAAIEQLESLEAELEKADA